MRGVLRNPRKTPTLNIVVFFQHIFLTRQKDEI